jgi:hypothetical protein
MPHKLTQYKITTFLVVIISLSLLSAPVAAVVEIDGSATDITFNPDNQNTDEIQFEVTNTGNETGEVVVDINESSLPSNLTLEGIDGTDPNPADQFAVIVNQDAATVTFSDLDASETVTVTATVADATTSADATINGSLTADVNREGGTVETLTANITTEQEQDIVAEYEGDDGEVGTFDVLDAINDFRSDKIDDTFRLLELIDAFRGSGSASQR